jgi:hypothetical protein
VKLVALLAPGAGAITIAVMSFGADIFGHPIICTFHTQ